LSLFGWTLHPQLELHALLLSDMNILCSQYLLGKNPLQEEAEYRLSAGLYWPTLGLLNTSGSATFYYI